MKFVSVDLEEAVGQILGHNVVNEVGRRVLRKGKRLTVDDAKILSDLGLEQTYVAVLEETDVGEDLAAKRVAAAVAGSIAGEGLLLSQARTGRVNVSAESLSLIKINTTNLKNLNSIEDITCATVLNNSVAQAGQMVATIKIIPYAVPELAVAEAEAIGGIISVKPLVSKKVTLVLNGSPYARERIVRGYENALKPRLSALNAELAETHFVTTQAEMVAVLGVVSGDLVIIAGETAIMDRFDIAPTAIELAGGEILAFGAPVDPGNLLMIAQIGETTIVGAPSCARSPKRNVIDLVLPRVLAGDTLRESDVWEMAHGGLLEDVTERPLPRRKIEENSQ